MHSNSAITMKHFILILVMYYTCLIQIALSKTINSQEQSSDERFYNSFNAVSYLENNEPGNEYIDFAYKNTDLDLLGMDIDKIRNLQQGINSDSFADVYHSKKGYRCFDGQHPIRCPILHVELVCKCPFEVMRKDMCSDPDLDNKRIMEIARFQRPYSNLNVTELLRISQNETCDCLDGKECTLVVIKGFSWTCPPDFSWIVIACYAPCVRRPCRNGGRCMYQETGYECLCPPEYTGKNCTDKVTPCTSSPCKNGGKCTVSGQSFTCICVNPYRGKTCEKTCECWGGECVKEDGKVVCKCPDGFGNFTSTTCKACDCGPGSSCMWKSGLGGKICFCKPGFYERMGKCVDCECGPDSNCTFISEGWLKPGNKFCHCKPGYADENGKCVGPCSSYPCQNNGTCKEDEQSFKCECKLPFTGKNCEIGPCFSNPCQNNGTCKVNGQTFKCKCQNLYTGNTCEIELSTTKIPSTSTPFPLTEVTVPSTKTTATISPLISTSQVFFESTTRNFTDEIFKTSSELSNITADLNLTTFEPTYTPEKDDIDEATPYRSTSITPGISVKPKISDFCASNPCQNDGICRRNGASFLCYCKNPYFGRLCEKTTQQIFFKIIQTSIVISGNFPLDDPLSPDL